jgi:predicted metalloendopeptidase
VGVLFGTGAEADLKDSSTEIMWVTEGGLGLPSREYYFDADKVGLILVFGRDLALGAAASRQKGKPKGPRRVMQAFKKFAQLRSHGTCSTAMCLC